MKLVLVVIGILGLTITLSSVLIPYFDLNLSQYESLPEKSLRTGIEDCIVSEDDTQVALNLKCYDEELSKNPDKMCGGQIKGSVILVSKSCIFKES